MSPDWWAFERIGIAMLQAKNGKSNVKTVASKKPTEDEISSKTNRGVRLKRLRNSTGLSRKDIENKYQIPANTLRSWEDGINTGLTEQGAKRILLALRGENIRCSVGWLLHGTGNGPDGVVSKFFESEPQNEYKKPSSHSSPLKMEDENIKIEISTFCNLHQNSIYLEVTDDGMEPFYKPRDYVAGVRYYDDNILEAVGKNCIIETQTGESYIRQLRPGKKAGHYNLICLNTQTTAENLAIYDVEVVYAAPIIWHRSRKSK